MCRPPSNGRSKRPMGFRTMPPVSMRSTSCSRESWGGSNALKNLWPQPFQTQPWNAHVKDQLENTLHRLVCARKVDLDTAQHDMATDWIAAYKPYFHTEAPVSRGRSHRRRAASRPPTARRVAPWEETT